MAGHGHSPTLVKIATCQLNQWALDFKGNLARVIESIKEAKAQECSFRTGPELEITGYGCEDSFLEPDTFHHAWFSFAELLKDDLTDGILCDIGMPVVHRGIAYNCRVWVVNRKILGIRPKMFMAQDGNYREMRYFTPWQPPKDGKYAFGQLEDFALPQVIRSVTGMDTVPFGIFAVDTHDSSLATELCEELFTPQAPHITLSLAGVEIIANGSGSHHQLRKLDNRIDLVRGATSKAGGVYMYANQKGCDGGRMYFDGCAMIWSNGECLAQGSQFLGLDEVEVCTATIDLADTRAFRANFISRSFQADTVLIVNRVKADFSLAHPHPLHIVPTAARAPFLHTPMEEIAFGPSGWLWDYLRRSGQRGYFLPLSGGADSSSTAALVSIMCQRVWWQLQNGSERSKIQVLADVRKITRRPSYTPTSWQELCGKIFTTSYMASQYSGEETTSRAIKLAAAIGANHTSIAIKPITDAIIGTYQEAKFHAKDKKDVRTNVAFNASSTEDIALQNIQVPRWAVVCFNVLCTAAVRSMCYYAVHYCSTCYYAMCCALELQLADCCCIGRRALEWSCHTS